MSASFSLIVPTWNEDRWLPRLLECAAGVSEIREVIVADHASADATTDIAREAGCRLVTGGRPAEGRNAGARAARSEYLLFADADVLFSRAALQCALKALEENDSVSAVHFRADPLGGNWFVTFSYQVLAWYTRTLNHLGVHQGVGSFIAVRRGAFETIGGFREDLAAGEDADFFRRIGGVGLVCFEESTRVIVSTRRFSLENPLVFAGKTCLWGVLRLLNLPVSLISYKWRRYTPAIAEHDEDYAKRAMAELGLC